LLCALLKPVWGNWGIITARVAGVNLAFSYRLSAIISVRLSGGANVQEVTPLAPGYLGTGLLGVPAVVGPLGVVTGTVAVWKGARWWGTAGVSISFVAAQTGFYLAAWVVK